MEIKTRAIVLRTTRLNDTKLIVDLLSREAGRISVLCRISATGRGKIKKQLFQPLTILDVDIDQKPNVTLLRFHDIRLAHPYISLTCIPLKVPVALFLAEFLNFATRDEQYNPLLYDYVEQSLLWLDTASDHYANFHLVFMMRLTRFIGFYPNLEGAMSNAWFDLRSGTFTPSQPLHPDCLQPEEASKISLMMRMNYDNMHVFHISQEERNRCADLILLYYRLHVPKFPELRSLEVVRDLFR